MGKVIIIIGLPGSGKSVFLHPLYNNREDIAYSDWGWKLNINDDGKVLGSFNDDDRFDNLITSIKSGKNVIIDGSHLCNHKFLCEGEYYLNLNMPGIKIEKYYFENVPKDAIANVLYREYVGGNHWKKVNDGYIFYGHHFTEKGPNNGKRMYEVIINRINKLSKNYSIPSSYRPLQIKVQDKKFYKGWEALIRE